MGVSVGVMAAAGAGTLPGSFAAVVNAGTFTGGFGGLVCATVLFRAAQRGRFPVAAVDGVDGVDAIDAVDTIDDTTLAFTAPAPSDTLPFIFPSLILAITIQSPSSDSFRVFLSLTFLLTILGSKVQTTSIADWKYLQTGGGSAGRSAPRG